MMEKFPIEKIFPPGHKLPEIPMPGIPSLGQALVIAEELAAEIGEEVAKRLPPRPKPPQTHILERANQYVARAKKFNIFKTEGSGRLDELLIMADSSNYTANIMIDGEVHISGTWSNLRSWGPFMAYYTAGESDGYYWIIFKGLQFRESCNVFIKANQAMTLKKLFLRTTQPAGAGREG